MSVERRCSRLPEGRADMKNSLRKVHRRASTSGMGTARRRLVDRSGPRSHVGQLAASQRVHDGHAGRWSSYLRKHVGDHGHNRAPRAGTRRRRQTPLKVSLRAIVRQGSSACTHRDSIRIVRALPEHGAAFFGRSLKVSIELEDEQPQDNFRLKAKRGGDNGGLWEVLLIHFEFFPMIPLSQCIPSTRTTRGLGPNSGACAYMLVPAAAGRGG